MYASSKNVFIVFIISACWGVTTQRNKMTKYPQRDVLASFKHSRRVLFVCLFFRWLGYFRYDWLKQEAIILLLPFNWSKLVRSWSMLQFSIGGRPEQVLGLVLEWLIVAGCSLLYCLYQASLLIGEDCL